MNKPYDLIEVGQRIREIRMKLGLSMDEFAARIDSKAKSGTVSNWETGKNLPNNERLIKIAELVGIRPKYILTGDHRDNLTDEELAEYEREEMEWQNRQGCIMDFQKKKYVQIEDFLTNPYECHFYINGHELGKEEIEMLIKLFEGKEKNYPSDEEIEEDYEKMRNEKIEIDKKIKEGKFTMSDTVYYRFHK